MTRRAKITPPPENLGRQDGWTPSGEAGPADRESLAALLWGENPTAQSKKYLRQALWQLQHALSPQHEAGSETKLR